MRESGFYWVRGKNHEALYEGWTIAEYAKSRKGKMGNSEMGYHDGVWVFDGDTFWDEYWDEIDERKIERLK